MKIKLLIILILFCTLSPISVLAFQFDQLEVVSSTIFKEESFQDNKEFMISPNPATSTINVYLPKGFENARLSVFDVLGKEIYNVELNTLHSTINISKWNTGVYLVRIATDSDSKTKRFVKQ